MGASMAPLAACHSTGGGAGTGSGGGGEASGGSGTGGGQTGGSGTGGSGTGGQIGGGSGGNGQSGGTTGNAGQGGTTTGTTGDGGVTDLRPHAPFVAVGYSALRAFSSDGKSWTKAPAPTTLPAGWSGPPVDGDNQWLFRGGCYGAGRFLAVGGTAGNLGLLMSSNDGSTWTLVGGAQSNDACAYGLGHFVTNVRYSTDGTTWADAASPFAARQMVFGHGLFVSVADNGGGDVAYSSDGMNWKSLPITSPGYTAVAYGNGRFLALNLNNSNSPVFEWDGASAQSFTETARATVLGGNVTATALAYGQGTFVVATSNTLYRRKDGATSWTQSTYKGTSNLAALVITDDIWVSDSAWSTDGVNFTPATNPPPEITRIVPTMQ
jgi:hypothetical protein